MLTAANQSQFTQTLLLFVSLAYQSQLAMTEHLIATVTNASGPAVYPVPYSFLRFLASRYPSSPYHGGLERTTSQVENERAEARNRRRHEMENAYWGF